MNSLIEQIVINYKEVEVDELSVFLDGKDLSEGLWVIDYIAHSPEYSLNKFKSFEDIASYILGSSGILNAFTTCSIPLKNGSILKYKLTRNENGKVIIFSKEEQLASSDPFKEDTYKWEIEWKPSARTRFQRARLRGVINTKKEISI